MKTVLLLAITVLITADITLQVAAVPRADRIACPYYLEGQQLADSTYHVNGTTICRYNVPSTITRRILLRPNPQRGSQQ